MSPQLRKYFFLIFELVVLPACLISFLYSPFFKASFGGGPDGEYHVARAQDLINQFEQGRVFPGIAESEITFNGQSHYHDPMKIWIYSLLYRLWPLNSWHKLDGVSLSYWGAIIIAFFSFLLCRYYFFRLSRSRFWSFACATAFASCPGLLSILYIESHFPTQMAWLWAPGFVYYLISICEDRISKESILMFALFAASLMFSHPASFLWIILPGFLFASVYLLFSRNISTLKVLLMSAFAGLLLSIHHIFFVTIIKGSATSSKIGGACNFQSIRPAVDRITSQAQEALSGIFLPIVPNTHWLHLFQPGYLILVIFVLTLFAFAKYSRGAIRIATLTTLGFLGIAAFGLGLEKLFWRALPCSVIKITEVHFLRVYLPLASYVLILWSLVISKNRFFLSNLKIRIIMVCLLIWSLIQAHYLKPNIQDAQESNKTFATQYVDPHRVRHFNWANSGRSVYNIPLDGALYNRFLDENLRPLDGNLSFLEKQCENISHTLKISSCLSESCLTRLNPKTLEIEDFSQNYVLFLYFNQLACHDIHLIGKTTNIGFGSDGDGGPVIASLRGGHIDHVELWQRPISTCDNAQLQKACLVPYTSKELPIYVKSFSPYQAEFTSIPSNAHFLETHRMHLDFYRSPQGHVFKSPRGQAVIPLSESSSYVELNAQYPWWYIAGWLLYFVGWITALFLEVAKSLFSKKYKKAT